MRFVLPPSLGSAQALDRARGFAEHLGGLLSTTVDVTVARDYGTLADAIARGSADAAWAPPLICAKLESRGLKVAVHGVRDGASTYRAAIVCRASNPLTLATLKGTRAAWVDPDSVGGHLLAIVALKARGLDPAHLFSTQRFLGSYRDALLAVDQGKADVASIFAPPGHEDGAPKTLADVLPERVGAFAVVAHSNESPNDGVVVSRSLSPESTGKVSAALLSMHGTPEGASLLARAFRIERFEAAPASGYRSLYRLAVAAL